METLNILLEENPISEVGMYDFNPYGNYNPKRRKRRSNPSRNPVSVKALKDWTQGVDMTDVVAGAGGLLVSTALPSAVIVPATGAVLTTGQKWMKVGVAAGAALFAGYVAKVALSASAGRAAIIGGLAGTGVQALAVAGVEIGGVKQLGPGRSVGRMQPGQRNIAAYQPISPKPELY